MLNSQLSLRWKSLWLRTFLSWIFFSFFRWPNRFSAIWKILYVVAHWMHSQFSCWFLTLHWTFDHKLKHYIFSVTVCNGRWRRSKIISKSEAFSHRMPKSRAVTVQGHHLQSQFKIACISIWLWFKMPAGLLSHLLRFVCF